MDFARKQLEKYGWSDGKGLGKNENGISEALKPKLKRSVAGIGYDAAADFTEHWWSALYDKAANNVQVEEKNGETKKMKRKEDKEFEITNSTWRLKKKNDDDNDEEYSDFFVRTAVLGSGGSKTTKVKESDSEDDTNNVNVSKLTDEELFAACQGRTAHKGARHGLRALGKLARIEQQEQLLLQQAKYNNFRAKNKDSSNQVVEDTSLEEELNVIKKKKKKKKRCNSNEHDTDLVRTNINDINDEPNDISEDVAQERLRKKEKKSKKKQLNEIECEDGMKLKKKQKHKTEDVINDDNSQIDTEIVVSHENCSKKKKKKL